MDERAWFLVSVFLMLKALESQEQTQEDSTRIDIAINCFRLALPPSFCLDTLHLIEADDYARRNWIISTHLLLLFFKTLRSSAEHFFLSLLAQAQLFVNELSHVVDPWSVDSISVAHPFIACYS